MPEFESLLDLVGELRSLPAKQRQAILGSLSPAERSRMMALLNRPKADPEPSGAPVGAADLGTDGLSPWLAARVQDARGPDQDRTWRITSATRQLLAKSSATGATRTLHAVPATAPAGAGRSLLGTVGDMLAPRRARA